LKWILDELDFYQLLILDLKVLQRYHDELAALKFLSGLNTSLCNQVRGQILAGDTIPSFSTTLSRVRCVSMRGDSSSGVSFSVEKSAMVVGGRGRGGGRGCGRGHDSRGGHGHENMGPRHCAHCSRNNHTSDKCWDKFGKSEWAQIADTTCTSALVTTFSTADFTV